MAKRLMLLVVVAVVAYTLVEMIRRAADDESPWDVLINGSTWLAIPVLVLLAGLAWPDRAPRWIVRVTLALLCVWVAGAAAAWLLQDVSADPFNLMLLALVYVGWFLVPLMFVPSLLAGIGARLRRWYDEKRGHSLETA